MTQTTISVTRALAELKTIADQITRASNECFVGVAIGKGNNRKVAGNPISVADLEKKIQSNYDTVQGLIDRRKKLKAALVKSNAETMVTINNEQYTVAEAIELKSTLDFRNNYLLNLRSQHQRCIQAVSQHQQQLEAQIESSVKTLYGNEKGKADESQYAAVSNPLKDQKEPSLIDPIDIESKIQSLQKEIEIMRSEIDFTLSESNARTTITV